MPPPPPPLTPPPPPPGGGGGGGGAASEVSPAGGEPVHPRACRDVCCRRGHAFGAARGPAMLTDTTLCLCRCCQLRGAAAGPRQRQQRALAPSAGPTGGAGLALPAGSASLIMPVTAGGGVAEGRSEASSMQGRPARLPATTSHAHCPLSPSPFDAMVTTRRWAAPLLLLASSAARWPAKRCCWPPRKALTNAWRPLLLRCCCWGAARAGRSTQGLDSAAMAAE